MPIKKTLTEPYVHRIKKGQIIKQYTKLYNVNESLNIKI